MRRIILRGWMIHGIVIVIRHIGTSRAICIVRAVSGTLLVGVRGTLLVAVIVICVVGVIRRTTVLLSTIVRTAKDLVRQSDVLHA